MASLSLSFTQGFFLGQLSIVILIGAFIKFFIFGEPPSSDSTASARLSTRRPRSNVLHKRSLSTSSPKKSSLKRSTPLRPSSSAGSAGTSNQATSDIATSSILAKTYYNVHSHQPESLDWFNVLVAQTIAQFRADALADDAILSSLTSALNGDHKPSYVGDIRVTEISLGEEYPIFSNCRVWPLDDGGVVDDDARLQARMDLDLSDFITLGVETKLILNYPRPRTAVLPVALAVSIVRFSGTLSISFLPSTPPSTPSPSNTTSSPPTTLAFAFLPDYRLDLSVRSLVGSRSRLQDVPKIAQLVEGRLHAWFDERAVTPRFQQIALPSLWPRKQNTRGGDEDEVAVHTPGKSDGDVFEEAKAEVETERRLAAAAAVAERAERERREEGLRRRGRVAEDWEGSGLPGSMPGMLVS